MPFRFVLKVHCIVDNKRKIDHAAIRKVLNDYRSTKLSSFGESIRHAQCDSHKPIERQKEKNKLGAKPLWHHYANQWFHPKIKPQVQMQLTCQNR